MKSLGRTLRGSVALLVMATSLLAACDSGAPPTAPPPTTAPAAPTTAAAPTADVGAMVQATLTASAGSAKAADVTGAVQATLTASAPTAAPTSATAGYKLNTNVSGNLEMWHFWASPLRHNAIQRVIQQCQAELPNIKVTDVYKPFGDGIWKGVTAAVAAGSGIPDVVV